jgi:hypothetical protein
MFETTSLRLKVRHLRNQKSRWRRKCDAEVGAAKRAKKPYEEIEKIQRDWQSDFDLLREEIGVAETNLIIRQGEKYGVGVPVQMGNFGVWIEGRAYANHYLSPDAVSNMRAAIRDEKKARWEVWARWVPVFSALTGLGGVIIGLLSFLNKH